jgi:hypothetical protein
MNLWISSRRFGTDNRFSELTLNREANIKDLGNKPMREIVLITSDVSGQD